MTTTLTAAPPPGPMFHCAVCGASEPHTGSHKCQLDRTQRRRLDLWKRAQRAAARAQAAGTPCVDCGERTVPGQGHYCRIQPTSSGFPPPVEQIADALRRAGYELSKKGEA